MPLEVDLFSFSEGNVLLVLNFFLCTSVKFHFKPKWPLEFPPDFIYIIRC